MRRPVPAAVILCGGLGTRIRDVVSDRPKSLASVAGRPFLSYLLERIASEGASEVVLSAGHLSEQIASFAATGLPAGLRARVVVEPFPLGTAGAVRFAAEEAGLTGDILVLNGDTYFDGSLTRLLNEHERRQALAAVAVVDVDDAGRYGRVRFDDGTLAIQSFEEKGRSGPGWINAGLYALSAQVVTGIPVGAAASMERETLPHLVGRGLIAVPYAGATFLDIGTPDDYAAASTLLAARPAP